MRGRSNEPVAVETSLGLVLSEQMKGSDDGIEGSHSQVSCVNFSSQDLNVQVIEDIQRLWDYDSLGIRINNEVHEALREGISFNGDGYQVKLP